MNENEFLRTSRNQLATDYQRLRETLKTTQELLARSDEAMREAQSELQNAATVNQRLTKKVADLEAQHQRYLIETDRMLASLREELDEVLVSEINSGAR